MPLPLTPDEELRTNNLPGFTPTVDLGTILNNLFSTLQDDDWKQSVRLATTGNIVLSGTPVIDGVASVAGDRIFVISQVVTSENGIYTAAAGVWSRSEDANSNSEVTSGMVSYVEEGTINAGDVFKLTTPDPIDLGVTGLTFTRNFGTLAVLTSPDVDKSAAIVGVSNRAAREDHKHDASTASAVELTDSTNAEGGGTELARAAHTHAHGDRGGGSLHADVIAGGADGFMTGADKTKLDGIEAGAKDDQTITAGAGLTGGGSGDPTLDVAANADGSIVVNADDVQVGVLASDAQHGNLGGGGIHALVIASGAAGFMSGADKAILDGIGGGVNDEIVTSSTVQTSGAVADIAMTNITITPGAGSWDAFLSATFDGAAGADERAIISIYGNAVQLVDSEREFEVRKGRAGAGSTQGRVTGLGAGQTVVGQWRTVGGTAIDLVERSLILIETD